MSRKKCVSANWKMNMDKDSILKFANHIKENHQGDNVDVVVGVPSIYLMMAKEAFTGSPVRVAAQNAYFKDSGAFTGEISAVMLKDCGIETVIIGHSERRNTFGEGDQLIHEKVKSLSGQGFQVILCIGESLEQRESAKTFDVVSSQLKSALEGVSDLQYIRIAYEPIWAIGTGVAASVEQAEEVHAFIRKWIKENYSKDQAEQTQILYGGSVKPANFDQFLQQPNIDGGLVGGASLKPESFLELIKQADND